MAIPNPPTSVSLDDVTDITARLSWVAPASGDAPTTYEYSVDMGSEIDAGLVLLVDLTGLTPDTNYSFRVRSVNLDGASSWAETSFSTIGPPDSPLNLSVSTISTSDATVEWDPPTTGTAPTSYECSIDLATPVDVGLDTEFWSGTEAFLPGTEHAIRVRSIGDYGESAWVEIIFTTHGPPNSPINLSVVNITDSEASVMWQAATSGDATTSFEYSFDLGTEVDVDLDTDIRITGMLPSTTYSFRIRAVGDYGISGWSEIDVITNDGLPNPPINLSTSDITGTTATVVWDAPATGPSPTSYEYSINFGGTVDAGLVTELDLTSLSPGSTNTVRIRSVGEFGFSSWAEIVFSTLGAPNAPINLSVSSITSTGATVTWDPPASGTPPTSYEYSIDLGGAVDNSLVEFIALTGLSPESFHSIRVRSVGTYGTSAWVTVSFTTSGGIPEEPVDLVVADATSTTASFSWSAPLTGSPPTSYEYSFDLGAAVDLGLVTEIGFDELVPGSSHSFRVRSVNETGSSSWVEVLFELNPGAPNPPITLLISQKTEVSALAKWDPSLSGPATTSYEVSLDSSAVFSTGTVKQLLMEGLLHSSTHVLRVRAIGEFGTSDWTTVTFTTLEGAVVEPPSMRLVWDKLDERIYENGLDQGVLYLTDNSGVAWSGLTSVEEDLSDESTEPLFMDGVKYLDAMTMGDYSANLKAFVYPDEFMQFEGYGTIGSGIYADDQDSGVFGLSYRTLIGDATQGDEYGHKTHIVYNLTASPESYSNNSLVPGNSPVEFGWSIHGVPIVLTGYRPTAHIILDSRYLNKFILAKIEDMLYGDETQEAHLPTIEDLDEFIENFEFLTIVDNGDGTWTATGPDELITMINSTTFRIDEIDAVYLDEYTYVMQTS